MDSAAKLLASMGALLGAILWPLLFAVLVFSYRRELRAFLGRLPSILGRVHKMKVAGLEIELNDLANDAPITGQITLEQKRTAKQISVSSGEIGLDKLLLELDKMCLEYDYIRRTMRPSFTRTQEMTRIVVKMRAVGPSVSEAIGIYMGSGSAGSRLAAVAMMQMEPVKADIEWLTARFSSEAPFVFYHAALALTNVADVSVDRKAEAIAAAQSALEVVEAFDGKPDRETITVLKALLGQRPVG